MFPLFFNLEPEQLNNIIWRQHTLLAIKSEVFIAINASLANSHISPGK